MISKYAAVAAVGLLCLAGQASAMDANVAQLSAVKGSVMVNQNGSYSKAGANAALKAGSKVVASASSSAQVSYADGCVVTVAANAMATIGEKSPCASQAGLVRASQPAQFEDAATLIPLVIVGAIVIAGLVVVGQGSDNPPVSP